MKTCPWLKSHPTNNKMVKNCSNPTARKLPKPKWRGNPRTTVRKADRGRHIPEASMLAPQVVIIKRWIWQEIQAVNHKKLVSVTFFPSFSCQFNYFCLKKRWIVFFKREFLNNIKSIYLINCIKWFLCFWKVNCLLLINKNNVKKKIIVWVLTPKRILFLI